MKKKKPVDPELKQVLIELEDIARRIGYELRFEKGDFEGGYCILRESRLLVINSRNEAERKIANISRCLKEIGIDGIFVKPNIRDIIESESLKFTGSAQEEGKAETEEGT